MARLAQVQTAHRRFLLLLEVSLYRYPDNLHEFLSPINSKMGTLPFVSNCSYQKKAKTMFRKQLRHLYQSIYLTFFVARL